MKKKIAADLTSLAHRILQMKNKNDVTQLQAVAKELYEKLTVLAFTEKHFSDIAPTAGTREIQERLEKAYSEAQKNVGDASQGVEKAMEAAKDEVEEVFTNNDLSDLFVPAEDDTREEMELPGISTINKMVLEMPDEIPEVHIVEQQDDIVDEETYNESNDQVEKNDDQSALESQFERQTVEPAPTPPESISEIEDTCY